MQTESSFKFPLSSFQFWRLEVFEFDIFGTPFELWAVQDFSTALFLRTSLRPRLFCDSTIFATLARPSRPSRALRDLRASFASFARPSRPSRLKSFLQSFRPPTHS